MATDEHGSDIDEEFVPDNPTLRGETRTPDAIIPAPDDAPLDELPHRVRRANNLDDEEPDPGYDPDEDDLI